MGNQSTTTTANSQFLGGDDNNNHGNTTNFMTNTWDDEEHLKPFLESLSPGAGFRCLALFLLQHLLNSAEGYDARTRHVMKKLGVTVLVNDMERERDLEMVLDENSFEEVLFTAE